MHVFVLSFGYTYYVLVVEIHVANNLFSYKTSTVLTAHAAWQGWRFTVTAVPSGE